MLGFVLLLTPTGSLPSPRWRWWARAAVAAPVVSLLAIVLAPPTLDPFARTPDNPFDLTGLGGTLQVVYQLAIAVTNLAVVVGAGSLVVRFRRARGTERQQLRWVALAAALTLLGSLVVLAAVALGTSRWCSAGGGDLRRHPALGAGAAILRYRLYDLDRIVSRALAYGLLTVLLGGGYAVVVLGSASSWAGTPAWPSPGPPWPWPRCSSRFAAVSRRRSTGASTGDATTPRR